MWYKSDIDKMGIDWANVYEELGRYAMQLNPSLYTQMYICSRFPAQTECTHPLAQIIRIIPFPIAFLGFYFFVGDLIKRFKTGNTPSSQPFYFFIALSEVTIAFRNTIHSMSRTDVMLINRLNMVLQILAKNLLLRECAGMMRSRNLRIAFFIMRVLAFMFAALYTISFWIEALDMSDSFMFFAIAFIFLLEFSQVLAFLIAFRFNHTLYSMMVPHYRYAIEFAIFAGFFVCLWEIFECIWQGLLLRDPSSIFLLYLLHRDAYYESFFYLFEFVNRLMLAHVSTVAILFVVWTIQRLSTTIDDDDNDTLSMTLVP